MRVLIFALATSLMVGSAWAESPELPRYDPMRHCEKVAQMGGGGSAMIMNSCVDMEQQSYNSLKRIWAEIPADVRKHCDQVARMSDGSYTILESCIDMETAEAANPSQFKF